MVGHRTGVVVELLIKDTWCSTTSMEQERVEVRSDAEVFRVPPLEIHSNICLAAYADASNRFYDPGLKVKSITALREFLEELPDGSTLPCRGRDLVLVNSKPWRVEVPETWDLGVCVLQKQRAYFIWEGLERTEDFDITNVDLVRLVQFVLKRDDALSLSRSLVMVPPATKLMVLAHGFSPDCGPDYALIHNLAGVGRRLGWRVLVPNFLESYELGRHRGRSERVRAIYEELLCLEERPEYVCLVGHSQGGACSALAATDRIVERLNVRGLMMIGSESPAVMDGATWAPTCRVLDVLHAEADSVVCFPDAEKTCLVFQTPVIKAVTHVRSGMTDAHGDDISHDFLSRDLLRVACQTLTQFLAKCDRPTEPIATLCSAGVTVNLGAPVTVVRSDTGTGHCRIFLLPSAPRLFLALASLERLRLDNGSVRVQIEVGPAGLVTQRRRHLHGTSQPLSPKDHELWSTVAPQDGGFLITLAPRLVPRRDLWVDFVDIFRSSA